MSETTVLDLNIRCPKCASHMRMYSAPLGKIVRNPFAIGPGVVHDDCNACNGTGYVPGVVTKSVRDFARDNESADKYLAALRWSGDHFSFNAHGMYVGVELDGYLHT